ncbi:MAG: heme-binding domain-containing protein [Aliarcobacter sp.]|nr:heme-binding domain-containing protein [Aliarcobacter sp.]
MKRALLILFIIFVVMQFIRPNKENFVVQKELEIKANEEVMTMLKTSCFDCHSNETVWPWYSQIAPFSWVISTHVNNGRKALNFSIWENYTPEQKEEKTKALFRTAYAAMPLQSYLYIHEDANLTKEQRKIIRDWTGVKSK